MGTRPTLMQWKTLPRVADPNGFVQSRLRRSRHVTVDGACLCSDQSGPDISGQLGWHRGIKPFVPWNYGDKRLFILPSSLSFKEIFYYESDYSRALRSKAVSSWDWSRYSLHSWNLPRWNWSWIEPAADECANVRRKENRFERQLKRGWTASFIHHEGSAGRNDWSRSLTG